MSVPDTKHGKLRKAIKITAITLAGVILLPILVLLVGRGVNDIRLRLPGGVREKGYIELGGTLQYVNIRGADTSNPVVIFLHGGPGASPSYISPYLQAFDETRYTTIYYDQRSSGRNYLKSPDPELSLELLLSDLDELVDYATERFRQPIVIIGHSWGTLLGTLYAAEHGEKLAGYIGIGQVVDADGTPRHWSILAAKLAREAGNEEDAVKIETLFENLKHIEPFSMSRDDETVDVITRNKFFEFIDLLDEYVPFPAEKDWTISALLSPEFDWASLRYELLTRDWTEYEKYLSIAQEPLLEAIDGFAPPADIGIPVVFINGSIDRGTPAALVQEYYSRLTVPEKEIFIIEGAGHVPFDEKDSIEAFRETIIKALVTIYD